jgi:L-asparaginase II
MATMFSRLACDEEFAEVFAAMHRYPGLIGVNGQGDTEIGVATNSAAKGGAAGCIGVAVSGRYGIAVKSWDGINPVADLAAAATLERLGGVSSVASDALGAVVHPPVLGGGATVGRYEPRFDLEEV